MAAPLTRMAGCVKPLGWRRGGGVRPGASDLYGQGQAVVGDAGIRRTSLSVDLQLPLKRAMASSIPGVTSSGA
jgi:hypothetical protein